jgi:putative membrane protein
LCAFLTVHCKDPQGYQLNLKQKHFGKMNLFLFLSLIQSTIITLGDVFLLGVEPENFWLMLLFSALCSVVFVVIIFTLVSLFGNVGKAVVVVIMVFQMAGAGGIYPIQTNPHIFGVLHPLWPFTYGINGFREAIAGPSWDNVFTNIWALIGFIAVFLPLAALKKPLHKANTLFEKMFHKAAI